MEEKYSRIEWCCLQKNGIKLIEPNEIRGRSYLDAAYIDLVTMQSPALKVQNFAAYNACYNSFYSILQKIGIKCELHDCTFEIFKLIPEFTELQISLIKLLKNNILEIAQCHKRPRQVSGEPVTEFVATAKQVFDSISSDRIRLIRKEIMVFIKKRKK